MTRFVRHRRTFVVAALATLALRALTPEGYMPGSRDSGLLFELCPEGLPAVVVQALAGTDSHHHQEHAVEEQSGQVSATAQCPIGHMLASAFAVDIDTQDVVVPGKLLLLDAPVAPAWQRRVVQYRSRAPPA